MADLTHIGIENLEQTVNYSAQFTEEDLFISVFSRPGAVSSFVGMENLPQKFEKELSKIDHIFVYPAQNNADLSFSSYDDMAGTPINAGVETLQRIGKEVGGIFKKGE